MVVYTVIILQHEMRWSVPTLREAGGRYGRVLGAETGEDGIDFFGRVGGGFGFFGNGFPSAGIVVLAGPIGLEAHELADIVVGLLFGAVHRPVMAGGGVADGARGDEGVADSVAMFAVEDVEPVRVVRGLGL